MLVTADEYDIRHMRPEPGIYAFHLKAIRRNSIGLATDSPGEESRLEVAKENILIVLDRMLAFAEDTTYSGQLNERKKYAQHGTAIKIEGSVVQSTFLKTMIQSIRLKDVPVLVSNIESLVTLLPPIYVGIAKEQTLRERYFQHKSDYQNRKKGTFGSRLFEHNFYWEDVTFSYAPQHTVGLEMLPILEHYIQYFSRPNLGLN